MSFQDSAFKIKLILSVLVIIFISESVFSQLTYTNSDYAVNLQAENYYLNFIISTSLPEGNADKRKQYLGSVSRKSIAYGVGNAIERYYLKGPIEASKYVENKYKRKPSKSQEKWFVQALTSLIVKNLDDHEYFYGKLHQNSIFQLRLDILKTTGTIRSNNDQRKELNLRIDRLLKEEKLSNADALYLKLCVIDNENEMAGYNGNYDKYTPVISLWKESPKEFHQKQLLDYLKNCDSELCKKAIDEVKVLVMKEKQGVDAAFDLIYARERQNGLELEGKLRNIIESLPKGMQREKVKSMILASDQEFGLGAKWEEVYGKNFIDFSRIQLELSDTFKKEISSSITKKDLLEELNTTAIGGIEYDKKEAKKITQKEAQVGLGAILLLNGIRSSMTSSYGGIYEVKSKGPSRTQNKSWSGFSEFLSQNPSYNNVWGSSRFVSLPTLETKADRKLALDALEPILQKYPNNVSLTRWKFWLLFQDESLYSFDAKHAKLFLKTIIQIFALNQFEGRPGEKNKEVNYYVYGRNHPEFVNSDQLFLAEMKRLLGEDKWSSIVKYLEDQMNIYARNANLRALHIKFMKLNGDPNKYFDSYVKGVQRTINLPKYDFNFAGKIDESYGKSRLLEAYKKTDNLKEHGELVPFYHQYKLCKEAADVMSYYIQGIPWEPNKEYFFIKYHEDVTKYVDDPKAIQEYLEVVQKKNQDVGMITLYLMLYDLIRGDKDKALLRLKSAESIEIYDSSRMKAAFQFASDSAVDEGTLSELKDQIKLKFPNFFGE